MSTLVDPSGNPVQVDPDDSGLCSACGAKEKHQERVETFGGYWKVVCKKCGHQVAAGRGEEG